MRGVAERSERHGVVLPPQHARPGQRTAGAKSLRTVAPHDCIITTTTTTTYGMVVGGSGLSGAQRLMAGPSPQPPTHLQIKAAGLHAHPWTVLRGGGT